MCESLKKELDEERALTSLLQEQLQCLKLERLDLLDSVQKARVASNHDRIEKKRMELELQEHGRTMIETAAHLDAKLRANHERETSLLNRAVVDLKEELEEEKQAHAAARRGLDHLRTHFASQPLDQVLVPDQLSNLTLY